MRNRHQKHILPENRQMKTLWYYNKILGNFTYVCFKGTFERVFNKSLKNCIIKTFASNITRIMQMYKNERRFSTSSAVSKWHHNGETKVTEIGYHKDMSNTHADTKCGYCSTQDPNKISNNKINIPKKLLWHKICTLECKSKGFKCV